MATETLRKRTCTLKLEHGTDSDGNTKYVSQNLGNLAEERWNGDKALAVVAALAQCLSPTVGYVVTGTESTLSAG